ncbi:hypothetical protein AKJ09_04887 [Labilithrix luteola]|uniref:Tetratricopeptide repeat protein n=1 Tax=Labilithrix luteola TaxID=1391654 RepID=A0A0K1PXI1_9BACT|nr:hypothetical protein [Labilithrix luteola]AKU98223.1 hypothetical protein AKJ09_04887 [Labilithrix luteola]
MALRSIVAGLALLALATGCKGKHAERTGGASPEASLPALRPTTDGAIAVDNLDAMIGGQERRIQAAPGDVGLRAGLVELLLTRGQFLGVVADYERASALAETLVAEAPAAPLAWRARASTRATWHRFPEALEDLREAEKAGAPARSLAGLEATILAATGHLDEAMKVTPDTGDAQGDAMALASRALLDGELGMLDDAGRGLNAARARYRDVSPFPLAWMDAMQATLYEKAGERDKARAHYTRAVRLLPLYARAAAHLAALEAPQKAIALLTPVVARSDDPEVFAELGDALRRAGRTAEGKAMLERARARYDHLLASHREAYVDHAARFWLGAGGDTARALVLAKSASSVRSNDETFGLWLEAAEAARNPSEICEASHRLLALPHAAASFRAAAREAAKRCVDRTAGP